MLTEILTNILGQNGWSEVIWILIQLAFFLIIFLLPLRLHDLKKDMEWEFEQQRKSLEHEIAELKSLIKEHSKEIANTDNQQS